MGKRDINIRVGANIQDFSTKMQNVQRKMKKTGKKMQSMGKKLSRSIALPIAAVGALSVKAFATQESALKDLSAITGAVGKDLDFFKKKSIEMSNQSVSSASEILNAFKLMGSARPELLKNSKALAEITKEAITLSEASGIDLETSIKALGDTLNQMNLPASDAGRVINVLAAASKLATKEISYINEAMAKFAGVASKAGISLETSVAATELLGKVIPQAEIAGTNFRNIIIGMQIAASDQGRAFKGLAGELDFYAKDLNNVIKLKKLFGKDSIQAIQHLITERKELVNTKEKITGTSIAYEQQKIRLESLNAVLAMTNNRFTNIGIAIGNELAPIIVKFSGVVKNIANIFMNLNETQKKFIIVLLGITMVLPPLIALMGSLTIAMSGINLITIIIVVAITALIAISWLLVKHWIRIKTWFAKIWENIRYYFEENIDIIQLYMKKLQIAVVKLLAKMGNKKAIKGLILMKQELNDLETDLIVKSGEHNKALAELNEELQKAKENEKSFIDVITDEIIKIKDEIKQTDNLTESVKKQKEEIEKLIRIKTPNKDEKPIAKSVGFESPTDSLNPKSDFYSRMHVFLESDTWDEMFSTIKDGVNQLDNVFDSFFNNKTKRLDNWYAKELQGIESSQKSEAEKEIALTDLNEKEQKKRAKIERGMAIKEKAMAIWQATVNGIVAVTKVLGNPIWAAIVAGMAAVQVALIASTPIPAMAEGGLAYGDSIVRVGEYSGARSNPEVIAPLNKIQGMLGGDGFIAETRISGDDLRIIINKANKKFGRQR